MTGDGFPKWDVTASASLAPPAPVSTSAPAPLPAVACAYLLHKHWQAHLPLHQLCAHSVDVPVS